MTTGNEKEYIEGLLQDLDAVSWIDIFKKKKITKPFIYLFLADLYPCKTFNNGTCEQSGMSLNIWMIISLTVMNSSDCYDNNRVMYFFIYFSIY